MTDWVDACATGDIEEEDLIGFDHDGRAYAIYHAPDGSFYCTDGLCSHEQVRLEDGLVMDHLIEWLPVRRNPSTTVTRSSVPSGFQI